MKPAQLLIGLAIGLMLGVFGGFLLGREQARVAIIGGPDSDNYPQALAAVAEAKAKVQVGNTNVLPELDKIQAEIREAQQCTRRFIGQPDGGAPRCCPAQPPSVNAGSADARRKSSKEGCSR